MPRTTATQPPAVWPELQSVKAEVYAKGGNCHGISDHGLAAVFEKVGRDLDLAATALTMKPRPKWVVELAGELCSP